ncbi:hypothetical protein [Actinomadura flavalba]|uniref:hypothetical protein n=1 Tax=Actinomadura flavalba TaxID=1120938 RepID=UPI000381426B|nr:hypothetical protein [Actinomadura flavalba]
MNGTYGRGKSQQNPLEAEEVALRVMHHFRTRPDLSLGVVAMSAAQASAIEDAVDEARRREPALDPHFTENRLAGFFVKSLGNRRV